MYYRINNEPQIDSEIIEPVDSTTPILKKDPGAPRKVGSSTEGVRLLNSSQNNFPLWLLVVILIFLGLVGILLFLKINKKYSSPKGNKVHSFGYNFY